MPELFLRLRIYLDANVLISASLSPESAFLDFWRMRQVHPITSAYVVEEARRHLRTDQIARLQDLLTSTETSDEPGTFLIPNGVTLVEKDRPILAAAIFSRADYLLTGDKRHFQHLYNTSVARVRIISPGDFLRLHKDRIIP